MTTTDLPPHRSARRGLPRPGRIVRAIDPAFYLIGGGLGLLALATAAWGIQALAMTALAAVPVVFLGLIAVTRG